LGRDLNRAGIELPRCSAFAHELGFGYRGSVGERCASIPRALKVIRRNRSAYGRFPFVARARLSAVQRVLPFDLRQPAHTVGHQLTVATGSLLASHLTMQVQSVTKL
jgi:hypothetical protein